MLKSLITHWPTVAGLALVNAIAWGASRLFVLRSSSPSLWQDQMGLAQALLLLDTLLVIWWYTDVTATLARTAERQLAQVQNVERIRHKPFAVAALTPLTAGGYEYCVRNIGPGLAVSVWYVSLRNGTSLNAECLGALGPGESRRLPEPILRPLCDRQSVEPFALFAEALWTRTSQWTATANARGIDLGSDVFSRFIEIDESHAVRSVNEVLATDGALVRAALAAVVPRPQAA